MRINLYWNIYTQRCTQDLDGGELGQSVTQAFMSATGTPTFMTWSVDSTLTSDSDFEDAVVNEKTWMVIASTTLFPNYSLYQLIRRQSTRMLLALSVEPLRRRMELIMVHMLSHFGSMRLEIRMLSAHSPNLPVLRLTITPQPPPIPTG